MIRIGCLSNHFLHSYAKIGVCSCNCGWGYADIGRNSIGLVLYPTLIYIILQELVYILAIVTEVVLIWGIHYKIWLSIQPFLRNYTKICIFSCNCGWGYADIDGNSIHNLYWFSMHYYTKKLAYVLAIVAEVMLI